MSFTIFGLHYHIVNIHFHFFMDQVMQQRGGYIRIILILICIKLTPVLVVLHNDRLALVASLLLHLLLQRLLRMRMLLMVMMMMRMRMRMLAFPVMMRRPLSDLPFVIHDKKGEQFWDDKSSHVFRGRVSIGHFGQGSVYFERCSENFMYFSFPYLLLHYPLVHWFCDQLFMTYIIFISLLYI